MHKSNLILILSKLDKNEFDKFGKFLNSAYFNSNKKVIEFYNILKNFHPSFDSLELSKENIYRTLYKEDKVVMGTMYYLISETEALLEKFISIERIKPFTLEMIFLEELTHMGLNNLFDVKYKELKKKLKQNSDQRNLNNFILADIRRANKLERKEHLTKKDTNKKELEEPVYELLKLFLKNNLWNILLLTNQKQQWNSKIKIPMLNETLDFIMTNKNLFEDVEMKALFFQVKLILEFDEKYYFELKKILKEDSKKITSEIFHEILAILQNYILSKAMNGSNFWQEEFELSNLYISYILNNKQGLIPIDVFYQAFATGIHLEKFEWAKEFLSGNAKFLDEKFRSNAIGYGNAALYYQNKEYSKALRKF